MFYFDTKKKLLIAGIGCGIIAALLAFFGNPANMAICVGCFIRDTAGALGFHQAAVVQYARPEIIGFVVGAFIISLATKEFCSTSGSSPMIRFLLGIIIMVGTLVFLGCPLRMVLRMSAGDLNGWVALVGFILGVGTGVIALKKGFSLGRAYKNNKTSGMVLPLVMIGIFAISQFTNLLISSTEGPGSKHAPVWLALGGAIVFGMLAQKARLCFAGSIRDIILMKNFDAFVTVAALFGVMLVYNLANGSFVLGFNTPGIIAHSEAIWNILGMYVVGFAAVLAGGCPLRQLIEAGQGSVDAAVTVVGMFAGAAICHNFKMASSGTSLNEAKELVMGAVPLNGKIGVIICIILLFAIVFTNKPKSAK